MQGNKHLSRTTTICGLVLVCLWILTGCATIPPPANVKILECHAKIQWEVPPEAEITRFSCMLGTHEGDPSLIYTVGLKNVSHQPTRFRLGIYLLDLDKAITYLVPLKGNPPQLAPFEELTVKIPFMKTTTMAKSVRVRVVPMSGD